LFQSIMKSKTDLPRRSSSAPVLTFLPGLTPKPPRKIRRPTSARVVLTLGLVVVAVGAAVATRDATRRVPAPRACETAMVTSGHVAGLLRAPGRLMVKSSVRIGSSQPGQVVAVDAAVGARVVKGQIIARLDDTEQRAAAVGAESQLASAELLGLRAENELMNILQAQRDEGLLPELPEPDVLLDGKAGDAQLELLHTHTEVARRTAALSLAQKLVARRVIRAPLDGIVLERSIEPGESIPSSPPGPPLFVIGADPAALRLEVEIDERYAGSILPVAATFTSPAYGAYSFSGTIRGVITAPAATRSPRPYLVVLDVPNSDGALRPGMSAVVDLPVVTGRDALAVPNRALSSAHGETTLALVSDDHGRPEAIPVGVGAANADLTEVIGPGVAAGRVVVTDASPSTCLVAPQPRPLAANAH
jgi:HlyD family secretion protein